ncbi:hypothetical protein BDW74DRAFT_145419 [Aspergillus multicolor]|uniref:uncharacterized protein n=1 Tax=Aspergillus multicolor TaxID=41759 RepID=UPI003CCD3DCA
MSLLGQSIHVSMHLLPRDASGKWMCRFSLLFCFSGFLTLHIAAAGDGVFNPSSFQEDRVTDSDTQMARLNSRPGAKARVLGACSPSSPAG